LHAHCWLPHKSTKNKRLNKEEKRDNRRLAQQRILIEHVNARLKVFKIFSTPYRNHRKRFGLRINLICAVLNLNRGFVPIVATAKNRQAG
jgi:hypothetical protein